MVHTAAALHGPPPPLVGTQLTPALRARLLAAAAEVRATALSNAETGTSGRGVYVGTAGLALADLWAARRLGAASAEGRAAAAEAGLPPAADLARSALATARSAARLPPGAWRPPGPLTPATLLEGRLGPYVVAGGAAATAAALGDPLLAPFGPGDSGFEEWVGAVADAATAADASLRPDECEVLYGRAGVLAAVVFAAAWVRSAAPRLEPAARALATSILRAGAASAAARWQDAGEDWRFGPFAWHGTAYLGAAHGLAGIAATLLDAWRTFAGVGDAPGPGDELWDREVLSAAFDAVDGLQAQGTHGSGNLKSSAGSADARLVHWCHGSPGMALLAAAAAMAHTTTMPAHAPAPPEVAASLRRLAVAPHADVVWARGWLTTKGVGLCHGWAGNGYALLATGLGRRGDDLSRPLAWAVAIADHWQEAWRRADRPASLYEGLAGAFCFLVDVALWEEERSLNVGMPGFLVGEV